MIETLSEVSEIPSQTRPERARRKRRLILTGCCGGCFLLALPLLIIIMLSAPHFYNIPSAGMEMTLKGGNSRTADHIQTSYWDYRFHTPHFGDIIAFLAPKKADGESLSKGEPQKEDILVKRIIGLPQDTILIKRSRIKWQDHDIPCSVVYRNGVLLDEPYLKEPMDSEQAPSAIYGINKPIKLGVNEFFVMGDNRNDSNDSRYWGVLEKKRIQGKVTQIVSPPERVRQFP